MRELPPFVQWMNEQSILPEIIIVNDGSSEIGSLREFCSSRNFTLIDHHKNMGKGAAVRTGMLAAREEIRIFTDADIPFQYSILPEILRKFENPDVKVVCGDRRQSGYFKATPPIRRMGSRVFSFIVNCIMMRRLGDTQCGIKAFRADLAKEIFPQSRINGFSADIEWLFLISKAGIPVHWVNAEFRNAGESSVVFWRQVIRMAADLIRLRLGLF